MKIKMLSALLLSASLAMLSCKKDKPADAPAPQKKLKKVKRTEAGTETTYNLSYNAAGKLVSFNSADNAEILQFTYDAAGNLTGIQQQDADYKNLYNFTYANNLPVTGTYKSWDISNGLPGTLDEEYTMAYTIANQQVSKIKLTIPGVGETNHNLTYTNGNLTAVGTAGFIVSNITFSYGNKKPIYPKVTNFVLDPAGFSLQFAANNEILKIVYDFPGTTHDFEVNTVYTYDSKGYVLTSNDGDVQQVYEYE